MRFLDIFMHKRFSLIFYEAIVLNLLPPSKMKTYLTSDKYHILYRLPLCSSKIQAGAYAFYIQS